MPQLIESQSRIIPMAGMHELANSRLQVQSPVHCLSIDYQVAAPHFLCALLFCPKAYLGPTFKQDPGLSVCVTCTWAFGRMYVVIKGHKGLDVAGKYSRQASQGVTPRPNFSRHDSCIGCSLMGLLESTSRIRISAGIWAP